MLLETLQFTREILEEKNIPEPGAGLPAAPGDVSEETLVNSIIRYLRLMAEGQLDEAQRTADQIVPHRRRAIVILDQLAASKDPDPELEDIPKQVLAGLIRNLRTRIS